MLDDERMESAPNWSDSVAADYIFAMNEGELYLHSDLSFKNSRTSDPPVALHHKIPFMNC